MTQEGAAQYWSMTEGVFNCLIDHKRTKAFAKAIKKTVAKGDIVVDMGTGTGILAMLAAKAGAAKVYAVEIDKNNIATLRKTFEKNGYGNIIEVIEGSILEVTIPEKVDVIIGEMIATALIEELQALAVNHVLKFAKKDVKVLLNKYTLLVDLVENNNEVEGFIFDVLRYEYPDEPELASKPLSKQHIVQTFDFSSKVKNLKVKSEFDLVVTKPGVINGLRLSGKTTFWDNSTLGGTFAYDYPIILPIETCTVKKGDVFGVKLNYTVSGGIDSLKYSVNKK